MTVNELIDELSIYENGDIEVFIEKNSDNYGKTPDIVRVRKDTYTHFSNEIRPCLVIEVD